jgi:hypothetical protein
LADEGGALNARKGFWEMPYDMCRHALHWRSLAQKNARQQHYPKIGSPISEPIPSSTTEPTPRTISHWPAHRDNGSESSDFNSKPCEPISIGIALAPAPEALVAALSRARASFSAWCE